MSMTATAGRAHADPHHIGLVVEHPGPASKRIVTAYGFWVFLLSDIVMFSCFFAAYAVLSGQTAGGPSGSEISSSSATSRSRRSACCCRASLAAWPALPPTCATGSGSISA
ncbi:heme/copper-type cytochrome/quinol oxidase subunit 3 [Bradyrhizobium sp. i1.3.6]